MSASDSGRFGFDFTFASGHAARPRDPDAPLHILVLADFSGHAAGCRCEPLVGRHVRPVDCDTLEKVFVGFDAALTVATGSGAANPLPFHSLDDFHPDRLLPRHPALAELFAARTELRSPDTAMQGAEKLAALLKLASAPPAPAGPGPDASPPASAESNEATIQRLLGRTAKAGGGAPAAGTPDVAALVRQIVGTSSTAPAAPAGTPGLLAAVELELSSRLRAILHHPDFQSLETSWRSLDFLVRRLPDDDRLKLFVLDVSLEELGADTDGLLRLLRDAPPAIVVGNYSFGASESELHALGAIARASGALSSVFLGGAQPGLVGCDSFGRHADPDGWRNRLSAGVEEAWRTVRSSPGAEQVALALPRFLLRQPYGSRSEPIESFNFEEIPSPFEHERFLWGNPAFLMAMMLGEHCVALDREMNSGLAATVDELPVFRFTIDGEPAIKPCAEAWLSERAATVIWQHGLTPCLSIKDSDAVRIAGVQSIASPAKPLVV